MRRVAHSAGHLLASRHAAAAAAAAAATGAAAAKFTASCINVTWKFKRHSIPQLSTAQVKSLRGTRCRTLKI